MKARHVSSMKGISHQPTIHEALSSHKKNEALREQVTSAELYFTRFVVEHNLPFAVADHFSDLCSVMFPDSKVATELSCARTKTTALVTHALAPEVNEPVFKACREESFTIHCDGGNEKIYFGILVRFWDDQLDRIAIRFLDAPVVNIATGETLYQALHSTLQTRAIPWANGPMLLLLLLTVQVSWLANETAYLAELLALYKKTYMTFEHFCPILSSLSF